MPRRRACFLMAAVLAACLTLAPVRAQQIPPDYQLLTAPQTSGGLLLAKRQGVTGATRLLSQGFREVSPFFDRRPEVLGGFAETQDRYAEAPFRATSRGMSIVGVAFAMAQGGAAIVGVAFDDPNTFGQSLPRLLQVAGLSGGSGCPPPPRTWQTVPYFDGSGQMTLPEGWQLTSAHQGAATAQGPHGIVESGISFPAISRAGAAQRAQFGLPTLLPVADPTDVPTALVGIWAALVQQGLVPPVRIRRVIESMPVPTQSAVPMRAGFVHYEIEHEGVIQRVLALVNLAALGTDGQWLYVESHIIAPLSCFGENLPTLFRIWTSAQVSPQEFQRRLEGAMSSLHAAHEMQWQGMRSQSRRQDNMFADWQEQYRGTRAVEDILTGTRSTVDLGHSTELVRRLNEREPGRYREIPLRELDQ